MAALVVGGTFAMRAADKNWAGPSPGMTSSPESGAWDTASLFWNTGSGSGNAAFASGSDAAIFGGADGAYGIRCNTTLTATTIRFNNSGYALTNDAAISLTASASAALIVASGKTATIGTNVTIRITANGANYNSGLTASGELIIENGGTVMQPNSYGLQIDGAPGSVVRVKSGGALRHTGNGSAFRVGQTSGASPTVSVEGGTVQLTGVNTGCVIGNVSGSTGTVTVVSGVFDIYNNVIQLGNSSARGVFNLEGGSVNTRQVKKANASGMASFNFNGGTLRAASNASAFMTGLDTAIIRNGGAVIDNNGFGITIGQALEHSSNAGDNATDGGLVSTGTGSLTLTGTNSYNGPTVVSAGRLVTTTASVGGGAYSVANGACLEVQVAGPGQTLTASSLTLAAGITTNSFSLGANASTTVPALTVNGALNLNGTVSVSVTGSGLAGPNTYLLMNYDSISGAGSFVATALPVVNGYVASLTNDTTAKQLKLVYAAAPQPVKWSAGDGTWDTSALNWQLLTGGGATAYIEGAFAVFDDTGSGDPITVTLGGDRSPSVVSNNSSKTYLLEGDFNISGGAPLIKEGAGTLVVANGTGNGFSSVAVNAGTLQLGNNDTHGSLGAGIISNNGTLTVNRTDHVILGNVISGTGQVIKSGAANLTLSGANTYSGLTTINNGQLVLANSAAAQNSTVSNTVANGLGFSGITTATIGGLAGSGSLTLTNTSGAGVTLTAGGNSADTEYNGSLSGAGGSVFQKAGTGTLTLSGTVSGLNNLATSSGAGTLAITTGSVSTTNLQVNAASSVVAISGGTVSVPTDWRNTANNAAMTISGGTHRFNKMTVASGAGVGGATLTVSGTAQVRQDYADAGNIQRQLWVGGNNNATSGSLTLKDSASWLNTQPAEQDVNDNPIVVVGNNNNCAGTFTITNEAVFVYTNLMRVAQNSGNTGTVNLDGGTVALTGFKRGAGTGTINANGGKVLALASTASYFQNFTGTGGANSVNLADGGLTFDSGLFTVTVTNVLSGAGGLTKMGAGTLNLNGANTYSGTTLVSAGTLGGNGTIAGDLTVAAGSTLSPGTSLGTLTIGGTPVLAGTIVAELNRTNVSTADKVAFGGGASFGGTLRVTNLGPALVNGDAFDLFDGDLDGSFAVLELPGGPLHWNTSDLNVGGTLTFTNASPVAQELTLGVALGESVSLVVLAGKYAPSDADGDSISVTAVSGPILGGGVASTNGGTGISYRADATSVLGTNTFTYTVTDELGATDTRTVTVLVYEPQGFNKLSGPTPVEGGVSLRYLGLPGERYALDETPSLTPPLEWTPVMTNTAGETGLIEFLFTPVNAAGFFRTRHVP